MKCPKCGAFSHVLETRQGVEDTVRRRRECGNGHRFYTAEVQSAAVNVGQRRRAYQAAQRTRETWRKHQRIAKDTRTARETAAAYGLTIKTVYSIRQRHAQAIRLTVRAPSRQHPRGW